MNIIKMLISSFLLCSSLFAVELDFEKYCVSEKVCFDLSQDSLLLQESFKINFLEIYENKNTLDNIELSQMVKNNYVVSEYIKFNDIDLYNKNIVLNDYIYNLKQNRLYFFVKTVFIKNTYDRILKSNKEYDLSNISKFDKVLEVKKMLSIDLNESTKIIFEKEIDGFDLNKILDINKFKELFLIKQNKIYNEIFENNINYEYDVNPTLLAIKILFYGNIVKYFDIEYFKPKLINTILDLMFIKEVSSYNDINEILIEIQELENKILNKKD